MPLPSELLDLIARQSTLTATPAMERLRDHLLEAHGEALQAILFYGSCLRRGQDLEGLVDLYVLVDSYRALYGKWAPAFFNRALPPNVFYVELPFEDGVVRAKYAVVSLRDFQRGTSMRWFHSYLWGRFAQPAALLYTRDDRVGARVNAALGQAIVTFLTRAMPMLPERITAPELWQGGLRLSYQAELRTEKPDRAVSLYETTPEYYEAITRAALAALPYAVDLESEPGVYRTAIPSRVRRRARLGWVVRRTQGKLLSMLRLVKALFTFRGGLDYILWKIERHSGVTVEVSPMARRHPLLAGWGVFWRLYRRGAFR